MSELKTDSHLWKVVPLSKGQLLDVRSEDIVEHGLFRICETYRGGGGYDLFPEISERFFGKKHHKQFIVQLFGCNLDCPYCYVTREGVWGKFKHISTEDLLDYYSWAYEKHKQTVFHLMGGAPALQMKFWPELIDQFLQLTSDVGHIFHSDLLLTESVYDDNILKQISRERCLYAVDIKGLSSSEHLKNTRKDFNSDLFWKNLSKLELLRVPYYITFTNVCIENILTFWQDFSNLYPDSIEQQYINSNVIKLIDYKALAHVDDVKWGNQK